MVRDPKLSHSKYSENKKHREYELIEQFLHICPDFDGAVFDRFEENPDMIYLRQGEEVGFDSVIISSDQATADCYFNEALCSVGIPTQLTSLEKTNMITVFFENKLFAHWRRYSVPTVLVFSLVDTEPIVFDQLLQIAKRFKLPEFAMYNIRDYYMCDGSRYVKIAETGQIQ